MLEDDEQVLRDLARNCKDSKEKIRYLALHGISKNYTIKSISEIFCVDETTIRNWIDKWKKDKTVQDEPKSGRPSIFSEKNKDELKQLLKENNPKKHGVNASFWDTKELKIYFNKKKIMISRETLRKYLKQMGARYVKAVIKFPDADLEKQKEFAKQFIKINKIKDVIILFEDEMSAETSARKGYGWTFEKRLEIKALQKNRKRLNSFGAVCPKTGDIIQMTSKDSKAPIFIKFLNKINKKYSNKKVIIMLDNCRVHKSIMVKKYLNKHPNIKLEFLPPYSPDLNPQEHWWLYSRSKLLNNTNFKSTHQLATTISSFTKRTQPEQIMSICSTEAIQRLID